MNSSVRKIITISDEGYTRNCEATFIRLNDNGIMMAYTRYSGDCPCDDNAPSEIVARISYDEGESWGEAYTILDPARHGAKTVGSPTLMRMQNGDVGLFYMVRTTPHWLHHLALVRSSDEGKTFPGEAVNCSIEIYDGYHMLVNDSVIRLSSGRILVPITYHTGNEKAGDDTHVDPCAYGAFTYSDDDGITWKSSYDEVFQPFSNTSAGLQNAVLAEIGPKAVKVFWSTDMMCQYESYSTDDGDHFMVAQSSRFSSPCSPLKVAKDPSDGSFYAIWNPTPVFNGRCYAEGTKGQTSLVWSKLDSTATRYGDIKVIESDDSYGYSHPAAFFTSDGKMLLAYSFGDRSPMEKLSIVKVDVK
ncbi:MAG: exo-alpha-sialidase [Clostridia bacterium]|nr:exo-alpha-sialidase [Clostridia bacterium]